MGDAIVGRHLWHCHTPPPPSTWGATQVRNQQSNNSQRVIHSVSNTIFNILFKSSLKISQCPILHVSMHPKIIMKSVVDCPLILAMHLYITSRVLLAATSTYTCTSPQRMLVCLNSHWPTKVVCSLSQCLKRLNPQATPTWVQPTNGHDFPTPPRRAPSFPTWILTVPNNLATQRLSHPHVGIGQPTACVSLPA